MVSRDSIAAQCCTNVFTTVIRWYGGIWDCAGSPLGHTFFYKQLDFQFEPGVANGFCEKTAENCLVVA